MRLRRPLSVALAFLPLFAIEALSEDSLWRKINSEYREHREQGRYHEAEKASLLALAEAEKFGPEDYRVAVSLNELAIVYHSSGRLDRAEPLYRRALGIWEKLPDRLETATALSNLARLCLDQGNHAEVERLSKRALDILKLMAPKHPELANSLNNLADVHAAQAATLQRNPSTGKP